MGRALRRCRLLMVTARRRLIVFPSRKKARKRWFSITVVTGQPVCETVALYKGLARPQRTISRLRRLSVNKDASHLINRRSEEIKRSRILRTKLITGDLKLKHCFQSKPTGKRSVTKRGRRTHNFACCWMAKKTRLGCLSKSWRLRRTRSLLQKTRCGSRIGSVARFLRYRKATTTRPEAAEWTRCPTQA